MLPNYWWLESYAVYPTYMLENQQLLLYNCRITISECNSSKPNQWNHNRAHSSSPSSPYSVLGPDTGPRSTQMCRAVASEASRLHNLHQIHHKPGISEGITGKEVFPFFCWNHERKRLWESLSSYGKSLHNNEGKLQKNRLSSNALVLVHFGHPIQSCFSSSCHWLSECVDNYSISRDLLS